jgi:copper oxidase (laccase) domain-containing protein
VGWSRKERWEASDEYRAEVAKKETEARNAATAAEAQLSEGTVVAGERAVASFLAAGLTEIHLCNVCSSCQERLRRNGAARESGAAAAGGRGCDRMGCSCDRRSDPPAPELRRQ